LALAAEQTALSADLALPEPALAEDTQRSEEASAKQRQADDEHVMAPVMPPNPVDAANWRIWADCALLAALLNAILAEITRDNIALDARALPTTTLPHPMAVSSPPHCPTTYKDVVVFTIGRSPHETPPVVASSPHQSTTVNGPLQNACRHAQP
jgi:hypothetical protein